MKVHVTNEKLVSQFKSGKFAAVIKSTSKILKQNRAQSSLFLLRGSAFSKSGRHLEAHQDFLSAEVLDGKNSALTKLIEDSKWKRNFLKLLVHLKKNDTNKDILFKLGSYLSNYETYKVEFPRNFFGVSIQNLYLKLMETKGSCDPACLTESAYHLLKKTVAVEELQTLFRKESENRLLILDKLLSLSKNELFVTVLKYHICIDKEFEELIRFIRRFYFRLNESFELHEHHFRVLIAISIQTFLNEYVYDISEEEEKDLQKLVNKISKKIKNGSRVSETELLRVSLYCELRTFDLDRYLEGHPNLSEIKKHHYDDILQEEEYSSQILVADPVIDNVSLRVKKQYEDSPYPRWVNINYPLSPVSLQTSLKTLGVKVPNEDIFSKDLAGCACSRLWDWQSASHSRKNHQEYQN